MKPFIHISCLAGVLGLVSCSFIPQLGPVKFPSSKKFPANGTGGVPADIAWQKFFTDPQLKALVSHALANNSDLRVATLNVERARAQYAITRSELFPTVYGNANADRSRMLQNGNSQSTRSYEIRAAMASYEFDLFGRVHSQNQSALNQYFATDAARVAAQIALVSEVATQYITDRAIREQIEVAGQTLDGMEEAYGIMKRRRDAGTVSDVEMTSVEVQRQTARADLAAFRQQLQQTQNALVFLCGGSLPVDLSGGRGLDQQVVAEVSAGLPSDLLWRRPDVRQAEYVLRSANADIGAARAAFFPRVSLTASGGVSSSSLSGLFKNGTGTFSFAPNIDIPIFAGQQLTGNLEAAEVTKKIEIVNYRKSIQSAFREVADGLAARRGLNEQIAANVALVQAQGKRSNLATRRYEEGLDGYFEVLTAMLDHYASRQKLVQLRMSRAINSVQVYKALGGGW